MGPNPLIPLITKVPLANLEPFFARESTSSFSSRLTWNVEYLGNLLRISRDRNMTQAKKLPPIVDPLTNALIINKESPQIVRF